MYKELLACYSKGNDKIDCNIKNSKWLRRKNRIRSDGSVLARMSRLNIFYSKTYLYLRIFGEFGSFERK